MSSIEIHMISNRPNLDEFVNMWNNVKTDGKVVIRVLTTEYPQKKFYLDNGIKVKYIHQKTFPKTASTNHAWARNELLSYAKHKYILFFDDWQKPHRNILIEHLHYLKKGYAICGRKLECDKNGNNCKESRKFKNEKPKKCKYNHFWTCNSSARLDDILKVNGFDNRYNGGSGGEDYDIGMRISRLGTEFIYNPNAIMHHYSHDHLTRTRKGSNNCQHYHDLAAYKYIPRYGHLGDWNLMESKEYELWFEGPIKYYKCRDCGDIGILDSIQVYDYNRNNNIIRVENGLEQVRESLKKI